MTRDTQMCRYSEQSLRQPCGRLRPHSPMPSLRLFGPQVRLQPQRQLRLLVQTQPVVILSSGSLEPGRRTSTSAVGATSRSLRKPRYHYLDNVLTYVLTCSVFTLRSFLLRRLAPLSSRARMFLFNRFHTLRVDFMSAAHRISFVLIFLRTLLTNRSAKIPSNSFAFNRFRTLGKMIGGWHAPSSFAISDRALAAMRRRFVAAAYRWEA